jgi:halogenation protein CepH
LPATVQTLAPLLGIKDRLDDADFTVKRGATFCWGDRPDKLWTLPFGPGGSLAGHPDFSALNVARPEFDALLLETAGEAGAEVRRGADVHAVSAPDTEAAYAHLGFIATKVPNPPQGFVY